MRSRRRKQVRERGSLFLCFHSTKVKPYHLMCGVGAGTFLFSVLLLCLGAGSSR